MSPAWSPRPWQRSAGAWPGAKVIADFPDQLYR